MRRYRTIALTALLFLAACSGQGTTPLGGGQSKPQSASVTITILIPPKITSSITRRPLYVSGNTKTANVAVMQSGTTVATTTITCNTTAGQCTGTVNAPIGTDAFVVSLLDASSNVLSVGQAVQAIAAGTNNVNMTFNPVVSKVSVAIDPSQTAPYLSTIGPTSVTLDVTFTDPSGYTIVGPGMFISASNTACIPTGSSPCVTVTLVNSDSTGATTLSASSFTSATAAVTTTLSLNTSKTILPFDAPAISITAPGVPTLVGTSVPISPVVSYLSAPAGQIGPGPGGPGMSSLYGNDAFQLNQLTNSISNGFYHYNPMIYDLTTPQGTQLCCANNAIALQGAADNSVGDHLLGGMPAPNSVVGNTTDSVLWFADESYSNSQGGWSIADITSNVAYNDQVLDPFVGTVSSAILDPSNNIWFTMLDNESFVSPIVSAFSATSPPSTTPNYVNLPADQHEGVVAGLVNGPSGYVFAVVSAGGNTYIDKLALSNLNSGVFSGDVVVTPATNLRPGSPLYLYPSVGYSPADGMLYASDTNGTIYRINPSTGAATTVPLSGSPTVSNDSNRLPMTLLPDNSLAFVGSTALGNTTSIGTCGGITCSLLHVTPGANATAQSFVPACTSGQVPCAYGIWSIKPSGTPPNYMANFQSTDGGHVRTSTW